MDDLQIESGLTRRYYDRISRVYDVLADGSEHAIRDCGIQALALSPGECMLDVGFGTGHGLVRMARATGPTHQHFPHAIDCAPIEVAGVVSVAGFTIETVHAGRIWTLPIKVIVARTGGVANAD